MHRARKSVTQLAVLALGGQEQHDREMLIINQSQIKTDVQRFKRYRESI